jgi:hypothetical protein
MKVCIFDSLTQDFQNRVNLDKKNWHITTATGTYADGACLLKMVISLSYPPDTQAMTLHIRTQLTKTDAKIKELGYDNIKFNRGFLLPKKSFQKYVTVRTTIPYDANVKINVKK